MYHNKNLIRKNTTLIRWNDEEYNRLKEYQQQTRAPGLSEIIRELTLTGISRISNDIQITDNSKENKESNKENKENSLSLEKNALTHAQEFLNFVSQITDDERMRPYAEEFIRGLLAAGEDLEKRGAADLRRHFRNWLPKYQAKREIAQKQVGHTPPPFGHLPYHRGGVSDEQLLMKRRREEKAAELQRQLDAQKADAEEAGDAREAFFAKRLNFKRKEKS